MFMVPNLCAILSKPTKQGAYSQYFIFFITGQVRVFGTCKPIQLSVMKHSSLLGRLVSSEENGVL
jgi:hypothetical protein